MESDLSAEPYMDVCVEVDAERSTDDDVDADICDFPDHPSASEGEVPGLSDKNGPIRDLTLMLIYLTSWTEGPYDARRAWKGYPFETLDELSERNLIETRRGNKSLYLTEEGEAAALRLLARYGINKAMT